MEAKISFLQNLGLQPRKKLKSNSKKISEKIILFNCDGCEASFQSILGIVAWGNAGTQAAAENGNITTLMHADQNIFSVFWGAYYKQTTVVYGK